MCDVALKVNLTAEHEQLKAVVFTSWLFVCWLLVFL